VKTTFISPRNRAALRIGGHVARRNKVVHVVSYFSTLYTAKQLFLHSTGKCHLLCVMAKWYN
jgi:hypothetical protein